MKTILTQIQNCAKCTSIKGYHKFSIKAHGSLSSKYMLVSEAPGRKSLESGKYWTGAGGKILRKCLPENLELEDLFYLTDIVKCWPNEEMENRTPVEPEIKNCVHFLKSEIEVLNPDYIISLGGIVSSFFCNCLPGPTL